MPQVPAVSAIVCGCGTVFRMGMTCILFHIRVVYKQKQTNSGLYDVSDDAMCCHSLNLTQPCHRRAVSPAVCGFVLALWCMLWLLSCPLLSTTSTLNSLPHLLSIHDIVLRT